MGRQGLDLAVLGSLFFRWGESLKRSIHIPKTICSVYMSNVYRKKVSLYVKFYKNYSCTLCGNIWVYDGLCNSLDVQYTPNPPMNHHILQSKSTKTWIFKRDCRKVSHSDTATVLSLNRIQGAAQSSRNHCLWGTGHQRMAIRSQQWLSGSQWFRWCHTLQTYSLMQLLMVNISLNHHFYG